MLCIAVYGILSTRPTGPCGAARKSPTSGVEEEEENNERRTMNGRDENWELKQSRSERDKGGILAPLSARRGVRARNT